MRSRSAAGQQVGDDLGEDELVDVAVQHVRAQEGDGVVDAADERPERPGHLAADEGEGEHPGGEDRAEVARAGAHPPQAAPEHGAARQAAVAHEPGVEQVEEVVGEARGGRGRRLGKAEGEEQGDGRQRGEEQARRGEGEEGQVRHLGEAEAQPQERGDDVGEGTVSAEVARRTSGSLMAT